MNRVLTFSRTCGFDDQIQIEFELECDCTPGEQPCLWGDSPDPGSPPEIDVVCVVSFVVKIDGEVVRLSEGWPRVVHDKIMEWTAESRWIEEATDKLSEIEEDYEPYWGKE